MNSRESRWPFLYSSAGTRTHFAIRQSTVRELAITYGFISDAEDACGCDELATMRFRKTQPQRKILHGHSVWRRKIGALQTTERTQFFPVCVCVCVVLFFFYLLLPAFILYFVCWLHCTVCYSNGIKLRDFGDLCNRIHTVFGGERARERCDKTSWTICILIAYVDSQVVGKWRNNSGVSAATVTSSANTLAARTAHRTHTFNEHFACFPSCWIFMATARCIWRIFGCCAIRTCLVRMHAHNSRCNCK